MWRHRSVSLNNEKNCCEISEDKIAFCEKTAGLRRGKFSDSNSACLKVLVPVKIFQFQDMLNESERYQDAANGLLESNLKLCNDILALREIVRWNFRTISRIMIFWTRIVYIGYL